MFWNLTLDIRYSVGCLFMVLVGMENAAATMENSMVGSQKSQSRATGMIHQSQFQALIRKS